MAVAVSVYAIGDAGPDQQVDRVLFGDPGAVGTFDLAAVTDVDRDGVDADPGPRGGRA